MSYYFAKTLNMPFEAAIDRITEELKKEGFGVLTQIDVKQTMKEKLGEDFRDYRILGACNPQFAHKALSTEDKIGTMLPCNVIVQDHGGGKVEAAAVDPRASMASVDNPELEAVAAEVGTRISKVIESL
ncbi:MAG: DUF302 domain-containing protein [Spirochaetota bacterium]